MSRIGILTFHSANNFGALLQAVSLQKTIIEHGGTECELINYEPEFIYKDYSISPFKSKHPKVIIKSILRIPIRSGEIQSFSHSEKKIQFVQDNAKVKILLRRLATPLKKLL